MITEVWNRIKKYEGQVFIQIRGGKFTYKVTGNSIKLDRTNQNIPMVDFEKALQLVPLKNTTVLKDLRGPSYIYAILSDSRISADNW